MPLPTLLAGKFELPVVGSPLFIVSGPELVIAQCKGRDRWILACEVRQWFKGTFLLWGAISDGRSMTICLSPTNRR